MIQSLVTFVYNFNILYIILIYVLKASDISNTTNETIHKQTPSSVDENRTNLPEEITTRTILTPKRHLPQVKVFAILYILIFHFISIIL